MTEDNYLPDVATQRAMAQNALSQLRAQLYETTLQYALVNAQDASDKDVHLAAITKRAANLRLAIDATKAELDKLKDVPNAEAPQAVQ
jgi:DNA-binding FrmR family transcriptional regulator